MIKFVVNLIALAFFLIGLSFPASAQISRDTCSDRFEEAEDLYEDGRLRQVLETIKNCYETSSSRQKEVYTLSALAHKFLDQDEKADAQLLSLLNLDPFYQFDPNIPELNYMADKIAVYPKTVLSVKGGFYFSTTPVITSRNTLESVVVLEENFGLLNGEPVGFNFELTYGKALSQRGPFINVGLGLSRYSFRYSATYGNVTNPNGNSDEVQISFREKHWWVHVPIYMQHYIGMSQDDYKNKIFMPYYRYGLSLDILDAPTAAWVAPQRAYTNFDGGVSSTLEDKDISSLRNNMNFSFLLAIGAQGRIKSNAIFIELGYSHMLGNLVNKSSANNNLIQEINTDLHYGGFDFQLANLGLQFGYSHLIYKAAPKRR